MAETQLQVTLAVDDPDYSAWIEEAFKQAGAMVLPLHERSAQQLLQQMAEGAPCLLVAEVDRLSDLVEGLRARYPDLPVVLVISHPGEDISSVLSRSDVCDVWRLPTDAMSLDRRAEAVVSQLRAAAQNGKSRETSSSSGPASLRAASSLADGHPPPLMMGGNPRMAEIRDTIEKVSGTDVTVLIRGESGVGKEVAARLIFERSRRRHRPFIKVNCAAIPHDLLESELFGYEAGAFTGAVRGKPGKFELADHGTLFLDEIAEMHPSLQAKLLHVLQDGKFSRLGAKRDLSVNVRIVCATNKLLEERVREGLFREDLLYRINVVTIYLPPLRERRDEIPVLTNYLLRKYATQYGRPFHPLSAEVSMRMVEYDWPGNIRELENLCKRFVLVGSETQILRELSLHSSVRSAGNLSAAAGAEFPDLSQEDRPIAEDFVTLPAGLSLLEIGRRAAWEAERRAIIDTLEATRWNRREASRRLQVSYKALLNKIRQMGIENMVISGGNSQDGGNFSTQ